MHKMSGCSYLKNCFSLFRSKHPKQLLEFELSLNHWKELKLVCRLTNLVHFMSNQSRRKNRNGLEKNRLGIPYYSKKAPDKVTTRSPTSTASASHNKLLRKSGSRTPHLSVTSSTQLPPYRTTHKRWILFLQKLRYENPKCTTKQAGGIRL